MVTKLMITIALGAAPGRRGDEMKKALKIVASFAFVLIAFAYTPSVTGLTLQDDTTAKQDIRRRWALHETRCEENWKCDKENYQKGRS
jgi:hypothetical protein